MEEIEVPIEHAQEHIHEAAHESKERWISQAALASCIIAVAAAVSAMLAGANANEAMIAQIRASDSWSYYQAKGVKAAVLGSKLQLLKELGKEDEPGDVKKLDEYQKQQEEISEKSKELEEESKHHLETHETLAKSVTMFQVSIAIGAIAVLSRRRKFWYVSLAGAIGGLVFLTLGLLH